MGAGIELPVHLPHGDALGVELEDYYFLVSEPL